MNKLSGYGSFDTQGYGTVEMKFCNGTYELFAGLMGLTTLAQIDAALQPEMAPVLDRNGNAVIVNGQPAVGPVDVFSYLRTWRLYTMAAIKYAALAQGEPFDLNEWQVGEIIDEIGLPNIIALVPVDEQASIKPLADDAKKKPKDRIKASQ